MKSHIDLARVSDSFATDKVWKRIILDKEELLNAIRENNVQGLIREVLRREYGDFTVFHSLVGDITTSVMGCIAKMLEKATNSDSLIHLLDDTMVRKADELHRKRIQASECLAYWRGQME